MGQLKEESLLKRLRLQTMNLSEGHRLFILFFLGIIIGTLLINLFGRVYANNIGIYGNYLIDDENIWSNIDKGAFFVYCSRKYFCQVIILVALNCTSKHKFINGIICLYKGFMISIIICTATISFGSGGIILFLLSVFPHYFIYVPMFVYTIYFGMNIRKYIKNHNYISGIFKGCLVESVFVVSTSFLEAYFNLPLIINVYT